MASKLTQALQSLAPELTSPALKPVKGNLYQVLARAPVSVENPRRVHQTRWGYKQIEGSYWSVTRCRLKADGKHGTAWGTLYWKGKPIEPFNTKVKGALKYNWAEGESRVFATPQSTTSGVQAY